MKLLANLTLGKKVTLLATLGLILGVGVFSFLGIRAVNQATENMLQDRMTTARLVADYVDETLERALTELKNTAREIENADFEAQIKSLEDTYSRLSLYTHSIYHINKEGHIIWSKPEFQWASGINTYFYPTINQAIREEEAAISGLVLAPLTDHPVILLISPTEGLQGNKDVLVVAIDPARSSIGGFVQPIRLGQTGYVEIIDQNGVVVARTEPGPKLFPFERSDHSGRFADLIAAGKPTRGLCHTCHEPVQKVERKDVLAFVPLAGTRWGVVIRQSEEEALAPIRELRRNLYLFGAGLITVSLLFVMVTTRNIVSRISTLTAASHRITEGDLISPVITSGKDEIGILAQSLDEMRTRLHTSYGELEQKTKELSSLLSVSEILASLSDLSNLDTALGIALTRTLEIMNTDSGGILLWDEERRRLCYRAHHGLSQEHIRGMCCQPGEGIVGRVAQTGEAILVENIAMDSRASRLDLLAAEGLNVFACVPLRSKEEVLGVLNVASRNARKLSAEDVRLLESIATQIAIAVENARLHQEVQRQDKVRGELLREIFSIQEEERRRIARELHDETSQTLASLAASLEAVTGILPAGASRVKSRLKKLQSLSIRILDEMHRLIYELRPTLLDDLGLVAAARWLAGKNLEAAGVKVSFRTAGRERRLSSQLETTIFRVIQEAIFNIAKHAQAHNASLSLHFKKNVIQVHIKDDGKGFDVEEAISSRERPRGLGLLGMKERVELFNGSFSIRSRPGGGTEIDIEIPINYEVSDEQDKNTGGG